VSRWVVVLAGGVGSRFWPLSTPEQPKQLLPLVSDHPLLVDQLRRLDAVADAAHTLILTNASLVDAIQRVAPGIPAANIIAEPRPAGTAAALAWASHLIAQRDDGGPSATMISVHADWAIRDAEGFRRTLIAAAGVAERNAALVTVGVVPDRADPGLGYIEPGDEVAPGVRRVRRFVEKPSREHAEELRRAGALWNSGIFVWRVSDFLEEVRAHSPEVAPALAAHGSDIDRFFNAVKPIAVDHAVLERTTRILVMPGDFGWDDVGTWGALRRVRRRDAAGNATSGPAHAVESRDNVVHVAEGATPVVLYGVNDLVVVSHRGVTLVTTVERSADLKRLLDSLPPELHS
jgi:mannose-1-phosphate guanylyltransferase